MTTIRLALFTLLAFLPWAANAQSNAKPLTEAKIADLLRNYVSSSKVADLATQKGITFTLSESDEKELRKAGADSALIETLRQLAPKTAAEVRPKVNAKDGQCYAWIAPGSFVMGCSAGDSECGSDEKPAHTVKITKGFWFGQTSVTVGAWKRYRAATGSAALPTEDAQGRKNLNESGADDNPAVTMTWDQANSFCQWAGMRLPTEAEWEYAARAGSTSARYGDLDSIAWYGDNSGNQRIDSTALWKQDGNTYAKKLFENGNSVHPVAQKQSNAWKLYDILGNVWQWTADWYDANYYAHSETEDPIGPPAGEYRVLRGGSWSGGPRYVRVSNRGWGGPGFRNYNVGCRCAGELP